jgi:A/G-specific adenine glycosylase
MLHETCENNQPNPAPLERLAMGKRATEKTQPAVKLPDAAWRARFRRRLRSWYAAHARDLPWRRSRDPYAIWISEVMLQQTQAAAVGPYYRRFCAAFPTIEALAAAGEQDVLRLWEGLGYYRRARDLHAAARLIVARHGGRFPRDAAAVRALPGIGRYTTGAILSIAFDAREPILEANTARLFSRLLAYRGPVGSAPAGRILWALAEAVLPRRGAGAFNQALMELGSQVCTPKAPRCACCPIAPLCRAHALGIQAETPQAKPRPAFEQLHEAALVVRRGGRVLIVRRPAGGRWAGLWDFPRYQIDRQPAEALFPFLRQRLREHTGVDAQPGAHLARLRHGVTRFRITLDCYTARFRTAAERGPDSAELAWATPGRLNECPLSSTGRRLAELVAG